MRRRAASPAPRVAFGGAIKDPPPDAVRRRRGSASAAAAAPTASPVVDRLTDQNRFTGHHRFKSGAASAGEGSDGPGGASADFAAVVKRANSPRAAKRAKSPRGATPTQTKGNIFEKLTDHKEYTGYHRHRFDEKGKGKGKAGRDTAVKGVGSLLNVSTVSTGDETVRDISQIMRPNLHPAAGSGASSFHQDAKPPPVEPTSPLSPDGKEAKPTVPEVDGTIFERLTDSKLYTGHHKHRFDQETGEGRGLDGRDSLSKGTGTVSHVEVRPDGDKVHSIAQLFRPHLHEVAHPSQQDESRQKREAVVSARTRRAKSPRGEGKPYTEIDIKEGSIFEKLTNPAEYTGHHKHRFDPETGRGRGLDGRDRIYKGNGSHITDPVSANGEVLGISQMMRPHLNNGPTSPRREGESDTGRGKRSARARRARSPRAASPSPKASPPVFDRLTDSARFTGHHKLRFGDGEQHTATNKS